MKKHYRHENDCLNCGTILEGKFCHNCGQENLQMKESFGHMFTHAVSDYFHFDDQFFHTLRPLFLQPGKLTVEYAAGRRAQYLHPVKMYIFISLLFFVLFFQNKRNEPLKVKNNKQTEQENRQKAKMIDKGIYGNRSLTAQQKKQVADKIKTFLPDTIAKEIKADMAKDSVKAKKAEDDDAGFTIYGDDRDGKTYSDYLALQNKMPAADRDNFIQHYLKKKNFDWKSRGKNAKEILSEGLKHNAPKMMFLLLPLFALILKIAFWKNNKFYVEHIIYAIHLHCFLFLFLAFTTVIGLILPESWDGVMALVGIISTGIITWYIYRSLRTVYGRSRWRTISKMIGVGLMYSVVFGFCFIVILAITAITTV